MVSSIYEGSGLLGFTSKSFGTQCPKGAPNAAPVQARRGHLLLHSHHMYHYGVCCF